MSNLMSKQALIENILDLWLSQRQLEDIRNEWKAFYDNPLKYKNSIVPSLVKLGLSEL